MPTAILIDGDFFIRRYRTLRDKQTPDEVAKGLHKMCLSHLRQQNTTRKLYRIFFYDCAPLSNKIHNPITKEPIDLSKTPTGLWRIAFHEELRKLRKVALRFGYLDSAYAHWVLKSESFKNVLAGRTPVEDLEAYDVRYEVRQKGVDMRIGLDIASMAFKQQVDQMILVSGDSDFVPAAKLARREGIDFILDPMWAPIRKDLHEHIDGLRSVFHKDENLEERVSQREEEANES